MSATATAVSSAEKPVRRFPPPCWTQDEALALIQAYRERWYALRRGYLRTADWDAVAEEVGRLSPGAIPPKTSAQCRHKIEKLRQRYRAEKQRALSFPGGRFLSTWFYFEAMDSMEKNGNGSGADEEINTGSDFNSLNSRNSGGLQIVNSQITHQLNTNMDSVYEGLNPGRGIRFKSVAADSNLVTVASRANNIRASNNYSAKEEDNDDQFEDVYYTETPIGKNSGKTHRLSSQNYSSMFQSDAVNYQIQNLEHSGARPRKFSKISSNSNHNHSYWNEHGEEDDNSVEEEDVWVKMPKDRSSVSMDYNEKYSERVNRNSGVKQENDSIGQIVSSIKVLADGFVKMEKMKMDMVHDIEKMRMEAEMKRNTLLLESQRQIVEAFVKGLSQNKTRQQ